MTFSEASCAFVFLYARLSSDFPKASFARRDFSRAFDTLSSADDTLASTFSRTACSFFSAASSCSTLALPLSRSLARSASALATCASPADRTDCSFFSAISIASVACLVFSFCASRAFSASMTSRAAYSSRLRALTTASAAALAPSVRFFSMMEAACLDALSRGPLRAELIADCTPRNDGVIGNEAYPTATMSYLPLCLRILFRIRDASKTFRRRFSCAASFNLRSLRSLKGCGSPENAWKTSIKSRWSVV